MATNTTTRRSTLASIFSTLALASLGAVALVWLSVQPAQANHNDPTASFQGLATVEGENVPVGTPVSAYVRGVKVMETQTFDIDGDSVYSIDIGRDDENTKAIEGARENDLVVFHIDGHRSARDAFWQNGTIQYLDIDGQTDEPPVTIAAR